MTIEILYGEVCNLFGDSGNISYLKASLPEAVWINTELNDTPYFVQHDVDMIYLGSGTENIQKRVIEKLMPFKDRIKELIAAGKIILVTGNMTDILCRTIDYGNGEKTDAMGLVPLDVKVEFNNRHNSLFLGKFQDMDIVGFNSRFSHAYGDISGMEFMKVERGIGINRETMSDGIRINNLYATQTIGPLLPLNPPFTKYIMGILGAESTEPAFWEASMEAYNQRLGEYKNPETKLN